MVKPESPEYKFANLSEAAKRLISIAISKIRAGFSKINVVT